LIFLKRKDKKMKKTSLLAVLAAGAIMMSGCASPKLSKTAIEVNDTKVTVGDIAAMVPSYINYGYDFDSAVSMLSQQMEESFKYGAVAETMGLELTDEDKQMVIQERASFAGQAGGLKKYEKFLKESGSSLEFVESLFSATLLQSKVNDKIREELGDAEPTDEELKAYFLENYMRAKHVLIEKEPKEETEETSEAADAKEKVYGEEEANKILERAKKGEDFDTLVKTYSTDPGSETNPDGYVFTDGEMVKEFQECVESLKPGEFGICESEFGYHIIQRLPLSAEEAKFEDWYKEKQSNVSSAFESKKITDKLDKLCEEHGITSKVYDDVIAVLEESDLAEYTASQPMLG
jgi:parvulin-like peptidyl-prolyl isomerase